MDEAIKAQADLLADTRTYLSNKSPYRDAGGRVIGLIGISRDITASRLDHELLRHSETRWQFAIDGAGDGIWDWDIKSGGSSTRGSGRRCSGTPPTRWAPRWRTG